jgi:hypothetical protein
MFWLAPALLVGAGIGAVLAVWVAKLDPDALKIYLGAMTALMGAGLALFNSRLMDLRSDRRAQDRKLRLLLWRTQSAAAAAQTFLRDLREVQKAGLIGRSAEDYANSAANSAEVRGAATSMQLLSGWCSELPKFDDVIETVEDMKEANIVATFFRHIQLHYTEGSRGTFELLADSLRSTSDIDGFEQLAEMLDKGARHFLVRTLSVGARA